MRATKHNYFLTHGTYPFLMEELATILRDSFFSLNFDESSINHTTQLDANVSIFDHVLSRVKKMNLVTIEMEQGTTAGEIVDAILGELDRLRIPLENIVQV